MKYKAETSTDIAPTSETLYPTQLEPVALSVHRIFNHNIPTFTPTGVPGINDRYNRGPASRPSPPL